MKNNTGKVREICQYFEIKDQISQLFNEVTTHDLKQRKCDN